MERLSKQFSFRRYNNLLILLDLYMKENETKDQIGGRGQSIIIRELKTIAKKEQRKRKKKKTANQVLSPHVIQLQSALAGKLKTAIRLMIKSNFIACNGT